MQGKNIVNITIGASSLKIIHCELHDTDIVIKNSAVLETASNLYINKEKLNLGFIENKLRMFFFENNIKGGKICYTLPDYFINTRIISKQQILNKDYLSGLIKGKILHELIDENISNEENYTFDCDIVNSIKFHGDDSSGATDVMVSYLDTNIVRDLKQMSKRLKMTPAILEPEINGFVRFIEMFDMKNNYMIIDIGEIYSKISIISAKPSYSLETHIIPTGVYKLDGLLASLYRCPPMVATERRLSEGILTDNAQLAPVVEAVSKDVFANPITEQLLNIHNLYGGLHYIDKFMIAGGGWNIKGLKDFIEEYTLKQFDYNLKFEDFSCFSSGLQFDNEIVQRDVMDNINSYASCIGLSLRGGF